MGLVLLWLWKHPSNMQSLAIDGLAVGAAWRLIGVFTMTFPPRSPYCPASFLLDRIVCLDCQLSPSTRGDHNPSSETDVPVLTGHGKAMCAPLGLILNEQCLLYAVPASLPSKPQPQTSNYYYF